MLQSGHTDGAAPSLDLLDAAGAVHDFAHWCAAWHGDGNEAPETLLLQLHRANFDLWHLEDRARDPRADDKVIAQVKRVIDRVNQQRNDLVEQHDAALLNALGEFRLPNTSAPLHSETPGMMLDRLSILSLKIFHTQEEAERLDTTAAHQERNQLRLRTLQQQRADLARCLEDMWREVCRGNRQFKLYRQLKMYNDPELNPILYRT